ncbi:hypothetical protein CF326_g8842, partial [Tilletia indica]
MAKRKRPTRAQRVIFEGETDSGELLTFTQGGKAYFKDRNDGPELVMNEEGITTIAVPSDDESESDPNEDFERPIPQGSAVSNLPPYSTHMPQVPLSSLLPPAVGFPLAAEPLSVAATPARSLS